MAVRREFEQRYARFWRRLANFLKNNSGLHVGGVAREGSRRRGTHLDRSDLDVIFMISNDPRKSEIYPMLIDQLTNGMNVGARIGSSFNAIKISKDQIRCDLILLPQSQFQVQINNRQFVEI